MSKPKVLIIGPTPPPYNGMSVATELVLEAVRDDLSVIHLDTADRRSLSNIGKIDPVNVLLAGYHGIKYVTLLFLKRPEIVYVPIAQDALAFLRDSLFLIPARFLRKKLVIHLHGGYFGTFYRTASAPLRWLIRCALGKSDRAIVLGSALGSVFEGVIPQDHIRVVPNGIPDRFNGHSHVTTNGHRYTILFLSTLMREKGLLDVLRALPDILEHVAGVKVIFAGEWFRTEDKQVAERMVHEFQLEAHVEFIGPVAPPKKYEVLKSADLFVMPTLYKNEGHPYVILEAMSASLPVISTNVGCIPETVINGVNGFIVEPGNNKELAEKVVLVLTNQDLRERMAEASRKRFLELYTQARFSDQMKSVFKELLS